MPAGSERARFWGDLVRELREEHGMSQRRAATETGLNRTTLGRIERGTGCPTAEHIDALLQLFGYELHAIKIDRD